MSWFPIIGATLLATGLNESYNTEHQGWGQTYNLIKNKCLRNADIDVFTKLENYSSNYYDLFEDLEFPRHPSHQEMVNFACSELQPRSFTYLTNIAEKLEPCLDVQEKYIIDVLVEVYNSSHTGDCKDGGKNLLEVVKAFKSAHCERIKFTGDLKKDLNCPKSINIIQHLDDINYVWIKKDFCSDIKVFHNCAEDYLRKVCNNDDKFIEAFNSQYAHLLNSCKDTFSQ